MLRLFGFLLLSVSAVMFVAHKEAANAASASATAAQNRYRMVYMSELAQNSGAAPRDTQIVVADGLGNGATRITSGRLLHVYPRIDSSGQHVAVAEGEDERALSIVTHDLKTGLVEQWTAANGVNIHPRFSGNSHYLAFSGPLGPGGKAQIGIIDLDNARKSVRRDGSAPGVVLYEVSPRVISSEYNCYFPALSSDGSFVVFQRTKSATEKDIVSYDLADNQLQVLTTSTGEWKSPSLSFDDRQVAYTGNVGGKWHIYITDLLSKRTMKLTDATASDLAPSFRPDGSLVFSSDRSGHFELYQISAGAIKDGSFSVTPLPDSAAQHYAPSISGDISFAQSRLPDLPQPGRSSFGAVRVGDRIYVAGGHRTREHSYPKDSFLANFEYLDLSDKTWHEVAPLPIALQGFGLASNGKYIYAFGGFAYSAEHKPGWQSLDLIQRYDIATNKWQEIGHLPRRRSSYALAQVGSKIYLLGGWDATPKSDNDKEGHFWREIDVFDMKTEKVSAEVAQLPDPLRRALSAAVIGNQIILLGGISPGASHFDLLNNTTLFEPRTGAWRELPPLPFATFAPTAGVLDKRLFIFGGMFKLSEQSYKYVNHIFTLDGGAWVHTGRYLEQSKGFAQVVDLPAHALGILGGQSDFPVSDSPVLTFERFQVAQPAPIVKSTLKSALPRTGRSL